MKKIYSSILLLSLSLSIITPTAQAEILFEKPTNFSIYNVNKTTTTLSWKNPQNDNFSSVIVFRSTIPIFNYFSYQAAEGICDKIYEGAAESFTDTNLEEKLSYYYTIFARNKLGDYSGATVSERTNNPKEEKKEKNNTATSTSSLAGAISSIVNEVSLSEAGIVYNYNKPAATQIGSNSSRLALFIIVKSPHSLNEKDKTSISYFIDSGTPTTIILGSGERAGVLNSYLSVFNKLPRNTLEWQDVIKIANGRWPDERNLESEQKAIDTYFSTIYERKPDMNNPKDSAAVTVIAYGLRPAQRNMESEKNAIQIYRSIFNKSPNSASDWDLVRAIAYSGAVR